MAQNLIGIIGGSGLGDALADKLTNKEIHDIDTPFGKPSCPIIVGDLGTNKIAFLARHGLGHTLSPSEVPYAANIFALKSLGVHAIIASAAVGSLREEIQPKQIIMVDQFIDKTFKRQNTFFGSTAVVHCEFAHPVCSRLHGILCKTAKKIIDVKTHEKGTYVCMEGPQFSTRAESLMHRSWGADLIGMTAMPEAKLAREAQICYTLVALSSDYDCWKPSKDTDKQTLLNEIIGNLTQATENAIRLIEAVLKDAGSLTEETCSCRKSLDLAVWTSPEKIDPAKKQKLSILFE